MCGFLVFAGQASAIMVGSTDVGAVDDFLYSTALANSGDQNEIDWVNLMLGTAYTTSDLTKLNTPTQAAWVATNTTNVYAMDFQTTPEYFYIKTAPSTLSMTHFLYKNLADYNWGVIDLQEAGVQIQNVGKLSHFGEIGTAVPEPTTMLLLGLGLVGLAGVGRKFKK